MHFPRIPLFFLSLLTLAASSCGSHDSSAPAAGSDTNSQDKPLDLDIPDSPKLTDQQKADFTQFMSETNLNEVGQYFLNPIDDTDQKRQQREAQLLKASKQTQKIVGSIRSKNYCQVTQPVEKDSGEGEGEGAVYKDGWDGEVTGTNCPIHEVDHMLMAFTITSLDEASHVAHVHFGMDPVRWGTENISDADETQVKGWHFEMNAQGDGTVDSNKQVHLRAQGPAKFLIQYGKLPEIDGDGTVRVLLSGNTDSLNIDGVMNLTITMNGVKFVLTEHFQSKNGKKGTEEFYLNGERLNDNSPLGRIFGG